MGKLSLEAKVGLFFLLAMGVTAYALFSALGLRVDRGFVIRALFHSVDGLPNGAQVRIAGIRVGNVSDIRLDPETGKALVIMLIRTDYIRSIPADSKAELRTSGLLGDKYVVIVPGKPNAPRLKPGGQIATIAEPGDTQRILKTLGTLGENFEALAEDLKREMVEKGGAEKLGDMLRNGATFFSELKDLVQDNRSKVNLAVDRMGKFAQKLETSGNRLNRITSDWVAISHGIRSGRGTLGRLLTDESLSREALALMRGLRQVTDRIQYGPGVVSRLINDPELYYEARRAVRNMNKTAEDVSEATPVSTLAIILGSVLR